jgi:hypothetical protein
MATSAEYSPEFEAAWENYPKRASHSSNPKRGAWQQWEKRIKEGVDPGFMLKQTIRYAQSMKAAGKVGTEFVMMAQTFYGPRRPFEQEWGVPENKNGPDWQQRQWDRNKQPATSEPVRTERWQIRGREFSPTS